MSYSEFADTKQVSPDLDEKVCAPLLAILDPDAVNSVHLPDNTFDVNVWKKVSTNYTYTTPNVGTADYRIMIAQFWSSSYIGMELFIYDPAIQAYSKQLDISPSFKMPDGFFFAKAWNGSLVVCANETAGGGAVGKITSATLQVLPNDSQNAMMQMTSATLKSLAFEDTAYATAKSIDGTICLRPPGGQTDYKPFSVISGVNNTNPYTTSIVDSLYSPTLTAIPGLVTANNGFAPVATATVVGANIVTVWDSDLAPLGIINPNERTPITVNLSIGYVVVGNLGAIGNLLSGSTTIVVTRRYTPPGTNVSRTYDETATFSINPVQAPSTANPGIVGTAVQSVQFTFGQTAINQGAFASPVLGTVTRVRVDLAAFGTATVGVGLSRWVTANVANQVTITSTSGNYSWTVGPVAITFVEGLQPSQTVDITGSRGYAAIPTAKSSNLISGSSFTNSDILDTSLVESVLNRADEFQIRSVYSWPSYKALQDKGHFVEISKYRNARRVAARDLALIPSFPHLAIESKKNKEQVESHEVKSSAKSMTRYAASTTTPADEPAATLAKVDLDSTPSPDYAAFANDTLGYFLRYLNGELCDLPPAYLCPEVFQSVASHVEDVLFSDLSFAIFPQNFAARQRVASAMGQYAKLMGLSETTSNLTKSALHSILTGATFPVLPCFSGTEPISLAERKAILRTASSAGVEAPEVASDFQITSNALPQRTVVIESHNMGLALPSKLSFKSISKNSRKFNSVLGGDSPRWGWTMAPLVAADRTLDSRVIVAVTAAPLSHEELVLGTLAPYRTVTIEGVQYHYTFPVDNEGNAVVWPEFLDQLAGALAFTPAPIKSCWIHIAYPGRIEGASAGLALYAALHGICSKSIMFTGGYISVGPGSFKHVLLLGAERKLESCKHIITLYKSFADWSGLPVLAQNWTDFPLSTLESQPPGYLAANDELAILNYFRAEQARFMAKQEQSDPEEPKPVYDEQAPSHAMTTDALGQLLPALANVGVDTSGFAGLNRKNQYKWLKKMGRKHPSVFEIALADQPKGRTGPGRYNAEARAKKPRAIKPSAAFPSDGPLLLKAPDGALPQRKRRIRRRKPGSNPPPREQPSVLQPQVGESSGASFPSRAFSWRGLAKYAAPVGAITSELTGNPMFDVAGQVIASASGAASRRRTGPMRANEVASLRNPESKLMSSRAATAPSGGHAAVARSGGGAASVRSQASAEGNISKSMEGGIPAIESALGVLFESDPEVRRPLLDVIHGTLSDYAHVGAPTVQEFDAFSRRRQIHWARIVLERLYREHPKWRLNFDKAYAGEGSPQFKSDFSLAPPGLVAGQYVPAGQGGLYKSGQRLPPPVVKPIRRFQGFAPARGAPKPVSQFQHFSNKTTAVSNPIPIQPSGAYR